VILMMLCTDKHLICRHCGAAFLFTAFEQEFYVLNNLTREIECCEACRRARKAPQQPVFVHPAQSLRSARSMPDATGMAEGTTMAVSFAAQLGRPIAGAERYGCRASAYASC